MSDDPRIRALVEEILESKRTPEEVCANTPELLPAVRKRLEQFQRIGHQVDEMFPQDGPDDPPADEGP
jgi:serine/threonine-protein kinase